jgi:hypothetical protein
VFFSPFIYSLLILFCYLILDMLLLIFYEADFDGRNLRYRSYQHCCDTGSSLCGVGIYVSGSNDDLVVKCA